MAMPCTRMDDDVYEEFTKLAVDPKSSLSHTTAGFFTIHNDTIKYKR